MQYLSVKRILSKSLSQQNSDSGRLVLLVNYRWTLPVLAELFATQGSKVVTLRNRLGVGRQSLRRSLAALIEHGLVQRNPGHGHPMRPEYILTKAGRQIGAASERLVRAARSLQLEALAFQKWSLPVVHSLAAGANRFRAIQLQLPAISPRALSLTLKDLNQAELLNRSVTAAYPPISTYALTHTGNHLAALVTNLNASIPAA